MHIPCRLCPRAFTAYKSLYRHLRTVHERTTISCPDCGDTFTRKDILGRHKTRKHRHDLVKVSETSPATSTDSDSRNESLLSNEMYGYADLTVSTIEPSTHEAVVPCEAKKPCEPCLSVQKLLSADSSQIDSSQTGSIPADPFLVAFYMLTLLDPIMSSLEDDTNKRVRVSFQRPGAEVEWLTLKHAVVTLIRAQLQAGQALQIPASSCYAAVLLAFMENSRENGNCKEAACHVLGAHAFMRARHRESCGCDDGTICRQWLSSDRPSVCDALDFRLSSGYGIPNIKTSLYRLCETTMRLGKGLPWLGNWGHAARKEGLLHRCEVRFDRMDTGSHQDMYSVNGFGDREITWWTRI